MEASRGPWAAERTYIIGPQRRNVWPHLNISQALITVTQRPDTFKGSIA
jgi:hypothetical protein